MPATILLPASFIAFSAERLLLAVANRLDAAGIHSGRSQGILHRAGALVTQGQVVVGRSTLVAVTLDCDVDIRVLTEELRIRLNGRLLVTAKIGLVVVEVHILNILAEQVFVSHRGS